MKHLLEEHGITGWKTYPIELSDRKKNLTTGYHGFSIVGKAGPLDLSNQPIVEKPLEVYGKLAKQYHGAFFDINTWDGSDFFILGDSLMVIVTERVVALLKKHKITALEFQCLSDMDLLCSNFQKQ